MEGGDVQRQGRDREDASVVSRAVPASALTHRRRWLGRLERGWQAQAPIRYRGARWQFDLHGRSVVPDAERCGWPEEQIDVGGGECGSERVELGGRRYIKK